jgi:hypothetical protein
VKRGLSEVVQGTDKIQKLLGPVLFRGLAHLFDKKGLWVHNVIII